MTKPPLSKMLLTKMLAHPDWDEIISKLCSNIPADIVSEWLLAKYSDQKDLLISKASLKSFKEFYLDFYQIFKDDLAKTKKVMGSSPEKPTTEELSQAVELSVRKNKTYQQLMIETASQELDMKTYIKTMVVALNANVERIYDKITESPNYIDYKDNMILLGTIDRLGAFIDKHTKVVDAKPDQVIQQNVSFEIIDKQALIFQQAIQEVISSFDVAIGMEIMQKLNESLSRLKLEYIKSANNTELSSEATVIGVEAQKRLEA